MANIFFGADTTVQEVSARLTATGSRDPDVLFAAKTELGRTFAQQKLSGLVAVIVGLGTSLTLVFAILGIPLACFGAWCWRKGARNLEIVDTAYQQVVAALRGDWTPDRRVTGP